MGVSRKPPVKCLYCGETFYREVESYEKIGNRYAHSKCAEEHRKNVSAESYKDLILKKVKEYLGTSFIRQKTDRQIQSFLKDGKTLEGIYQAVVYWFDVKNGDIEAANGGIGIVDYIYDEAIKYYQRLAENEERYKNVNENLIQVYVDKRSQIEKTPKRKPFAAPARNKLFILD